MLLYLLGVYCSAEESLLAGAIFGKTVGCTGCSLGGGDGTYFKVVYSCRWALWFYLYLDRAFDGVVGICRLYNYSVE